MSLPHVEILAAAVDDLGLTEVRAAEASLVELARLNDPVTSGRRVSDGWTRCTTSADPYSTRGSHRTTACAPT